MLGNKKCERWRGVGDAVCEATARRLHSNRVERWFSNISVCQRNEAAGARSSVCPFVRTPADGFYWDSTIFIRILTEDFDTFAKN